MKKKIIYLIGFILVSIIVVLVIVFLVWKNQNIDDDKNNLEKLDSPSISIKSNMLFIESDTDCDFVIYVDDKEYVKTKDRQVSLFDLDTGNHQVKVKAIKEGFNDSDFTNSLPYLKKEYLQNTDEFSSLTRVGINYILLDSYERENVEIKDEGLAYYPSYMTNLSDTTLNQSILDENIKLLSSSTTYNSMDSSGNLYLDGIDINQKLYKHSASIGLYGSDLSSDELAVSKKIIVKEPKPLGNYITGLFAPAGEVIKIEISEKDLAKAGSLEVCIGPATGKNQSHDIPETVTYNRMPKLVNKMSVTSTEAYVGSYFGGPIYISSKNSKPFSVTISNAVEYLYYVNGYTSEEEFNRLKKSSAPYIDFEIYDHAFRFSGPRYNLYSDNSKLNYNNLEKAMRLWQNFNLTSRSVPHGMNSNAFITMLFDTYVANGALAMAYIGADYATLPISWMESVLDYDSFMINGAWGPIHEFNHHFQKFGCNGNTNEVTNNIMNYIEYILYTRITEYRDYQNIGHGMGLDSHNDIEYLNQYKDTSTSLNTEQGYAILVENFGPELMLEVFKNQKGVTTADAFYEALSNTIGLDFEYFFKELWHIDISSDLVSRIKEKNYNTYIPVGSFYSSSFNFIDIDNESKHALPYLISDGFIIDLKSDINTIEGFNIEILEVLNPNNGNLDKIGDYIYKYINDGSLYDSFKVKVRIYNETISEDIYITYDLNLSNQGIEVITYKYDEIPYENIDLAYEANFKGYKSITTKYQKTQNITNVKLNTIVEVKGKFIIEEDGLYQICYRGGRGTSSFYASINDESHFEKIGYILINQSLYELHETSYAYKEMNLKKGDIIYYKEYLQPTSNNAFLEIGYTNIINPSQSDVKKVPDEYFRGFNGSFDYSINYELRNDNTKYLKYEYNDIFKYEDLSIESPNFIPWDNLEENNLDKVFDDSDLTYAHSQRNIVISEENSIDLIIKSEKIISFNKLVFYGSSHDQCITGFDLYILVDDEYILYKTYTNLEVSNHKTYVLLDEIIKTKSIKLHVFKTYPNYLALSKLDICIYDMFESITLNDINYYGNVNKEYEESPYGQVYSLEKDSYIEYKFTDSIDLGLDIKSSNYEVLVDGKLVDLELLYLNDLYNIYEINLSGSHTLKIIVNDDSYIKVYELLKRIV